MNERLQTKLNSLPEEDKRIIELAWERHRRACERTKVGPDPLFLEESVNEILSGRSADILDFAREGFGLEIS